MNKKKFKKFLIVLVATSILCNIPILANAAWQNSNGSWWYSDYSNRGYYVGWEKIEGNWYYFNESGWMETGWKFIGGTWYYFNESGAMETGWKFIGGTWYYLNESGSMAVGWIYDNNSWYYLDGSGSIVTNTWVGNYYLNESGWMVTNTWIGDYYVGKDGVWISTIKDISELTEIEGSFNYQREEDIYAYTAPVSGRYRFDTEIIPSDVSANLWICNSNGKEIISGNNGIMVDLEMGEKYILYVTTYNHMDNIVDYKINIGIPNEIKDISSLTNLSGQITYRDQIDRYTYTAPVSGTYRFDTEITSPSDLTSADLQIRNSDNMMVVPGYDGGITVDLEMGKKYTLSIKREDEYIGDFFDYKINIGIPNEIKDISSLTNLSGQITYRDQIDRYTYTAPVSGRYRFDTEIIPSDVSANLWICNSNGKRIAYGYNGGITVDLEMGKKYTLYIAQQSTYVHDFFDYKINIGIPN